MHGGSIEIEREWDGDGDGNGNKRVSQWPCFALFSFLECCKDLLVLLLSEMLLSLLPFAGGIVLSLTELSVMRWQKRVQEQFQQTL